MLPWGEMLRAALAAGLSPEAFWRLSLREWRWLAGSGAPLVQKTFEALMTRFPDERET